MTPTPKNNIYGALRHPERPAVLVKEEKGSLRLPYFQAEKVWMSSMDHFVQRFSAQLGTPVWGLRQIYYRDHMADRAFEMVVELELEDSGWPLPAGYRWADEADLERQPILPRKLSAPIGDYLAERRDRRPTPLRPPWAQPGWLDFARTWIEQEVRKLGWSLQEILPVKQWGISCVMQIRTDGPDLYFKTTNRKMPLFVNEARITRALAGRFPDIIPAPLAAREDLDWMLLPAFDEETTRDNDPDDTADFFRRFAALQVRAIPHREELMALGAHDRRLPELQNQLEGLLHDPEVLHKLGKEDRRALRLLAPEFRELIERLEACGIPSTLVHGDLHQGNTAALNGKRVIFDWTDACISHPFFDLHSLKWMSEEEAGVVLEAYTEPWKTIIEEERLLEAIPLGRVLLKLHHAVSYRHIVANLELISKPELDVTHLFLKDAIVETRAYLDGNHP